MDNKDFKLTYIVDFPVSYAITCYKVAVHLSEYFTASVCQKDTTGKYSLYLTSFASSQPFSFGIYTLDISSVSQVEFWGKYLFVLDNKGPSGTSSVSIYSVDLLSSQVFSFSDCD